MNIVMPMAGKGNRFINAGYLTPKMLIKVKGFPMFYWSLISLKRHFDLSNITFICLEEHLNSTNLEKEIKHYCNNPRIIGIQKPTRGQAETVLNAVSELDLDKELLIFNCDTYFLNLNFSLNQDLDGEITVFTSNNPNYSYVKVDSNNLVKQIIEKKVISNIATIGLYYFKSTRQYVKTCEYIIRKNKKSCGEYYVSNVYEELIKQGCKIGINQVEKCYPLGSPDDKEIFENL
ncbi:glycosyltransferase family 2 protein [Bacillus sp. 166amftsu]|uniref:glycosyltransferase family 2 protein n=1 Tax=Bacillus sp. 166amftsu TaxID=1761753 RepID=UPI0008963D40|nr:glycosyltransferase family 2 protein [Bacillus sp. 166amftsu]SDZ37746.1 dTDP-glucose pyrophosphorylase [Bacillus sp. 166amftsu]